MELNFNTKGNLYKTVDLTFRQFRKAFGTNPGRLEKINAAVSFFKIFSSCGCKLVCIGGSFVSTKEHPGDIDLCFDVTSVNFEQLKKRLPEYFDFNKRGEIRGYTGCHIWDFDATSTRLLDMLEEDRDGNSKGLVRLKLKEEYTYD